MSAIQHAAVMRKGGYAALCGIHPIMFAVTIAIVVLSFAASLLVRFG